MQFRLRARRPSLPLLPFHDEPSQSFKISSYSRRSRLSLCLAISLCTLFVLGCIHVARAFLFRSTLVFRNDDLLRIWQWEIAHGHHPSSAKAPPDIGLQTDLENPARPNSSSRRKYLSHPVSNNLPYPSRPPPGSTADLDVILSQCDFAQGKLVKDCLSFLSIGAGLEPTRHPVGPGRTPSPPYIFTVQDIFSGNTPRVAVDRKNGTNTPHPKGLRAQWEALPVLRPRLRPNRGPCDPDNPRVFHMYWTGAFTDKPYLSTLSFLYTQNVNLSKDSDPQSCQPQLWFWINPGHAAALTSSISEEKLHEDLRSNPWSAPFMHLRFAEVIQFKLWDTTERLDAITELRDEWRNLPTIFNTGGIKIHVNYVDGEYVSSSSYFHRVSSTLSDVARFVLCHQFGGTYLDTDMLFLRDWEDLWGWGGAFTYRWSALERYNTAVLHLNKGSAIGVFILRTALRNDFDFHPMAIYKYMEQAGLTSLLYRLPDALFDPAWLNTEGHQRHQPPHPYFSSFPQFFEHGSANGEGFDHFFRGAYTYHFHNSWSTPVDSTHNYPNLGNRILNDTNSLSQDKTYPTAPGLSWSAVFKRTFETYIRGERPNMYGEWVNWEEL